ncbi:MAG: hypothetical protein FJ134_15985 [Deltaproteobacteria bacterium]|nr:hypothetical protein [Deltaproteobacteria bacterium]
MEHETIKIIEFEVASGPDVPGGLPRQVVPLLSPLWRGPALRLEYPDGAVHTVVGWRQGRDGAGFPGELQIFWTRHDLSAPPVCLAIGGDAGLRDLGPPGGEEMPKGYPFLALAESMIPEEVLAVIGPRPESAESRAPLLLA